ncbi:hypothetical protein RRG08_057948, partial [Elysia crispata]
MLPSGKRIISFKEAFAAVFNRGQGHPLRDNHKGSRGEEYKSSHTHVSESDECSSEYDVPKKQQRSRGQDKNSSIEHLKPSHILDESSREIEEYIPQNLIR